MIRSTSHFQSTKRRIFMGLFLKQTAIALYLFSVIFSELSAFSFEDKRKAQMIQDLDIIRHHFEVSYAPANWKKEYAGWDLTEAFESAKHQIMATPAITTKQFQQIVRRFMQTPKDIHVGILFYSTEEASLPFSVKGIEGRYFINWIDPLRLSSSDCALRVGDELLEFDGRPIATVMDELKQTQDDFANPYTTQAIADFALTQRIGAKGDTVPKGTVKIKTRSVDSGHLYSFQLIWDYQPEYVKNSLDFLTQSIDFLTGVIEFKEERTPAMMMNPVHEFCARKMMNRYGGWGLGAYRSFLPPLGVLLWDQDGLNELDPAAPESNQQEGKNENSVMTRSWKNDFEEEETQLPKNPSLAWHAYIYQHPKGYPIGYIRIPHYRGLQGNAEEFGRLIQLMEEKTEALVIDQLNNLGGASLFTYELAAMLTKEPLITPHHRFKITQRTPWANFSR